MPDIATLYVDPFLTNVALEYSNLGFVADQVLPVVDVPLPSGKVVGYTKQDHFTVPDDRMSPTGEANEVDWGQTPQTYLCQDRALKRFIPAREIAVAQAPIVPATKATRTLRQKVLLARENRVATKVRDVNNYAAANKITLSGTSQWNDYTNSTPLTDIETGKVACFLPPTHALIPWEVMAKLKWHPKVVDQIKYTGRDSVTADILGGLIGLKVIVPDPKINTANPGQAASYSFVWGKDVLLFRSIPPSVEDVSYGFTYRLSPPGDSVRRWEEPKRGLEGGQVVQVGFSDDEKLLATDVAYLIKTAVA